ncbi:hypothetical protein FQZ97_824580 [compost metagenome]
MVLHGQAEFEVLQQLPEVRAFLGEPLAHVGVDRGAAKIRAEPVVPAFQVVHLQLVVHRVRFPAEEHGPLLEVLGALHLGEHAVLAGLHEFEVAQAEGAPCDHLVDQCIAVVAGLDAVDLAAQLLLELRQVGEALHAAFPGGLVHRQGVLGACEIGAEALHRAFIQVGTDVVFTARHPVAKEDIDLAFTHRLVGVGGRQTLDLGDVAELAQHIAGDGGGDGDVAPADVGEVHGGAAFGVGGGQGRLGGADRDGQRRSGQQRSGGLSHEKGSVHCRNYCRFSGLAWLSDCCRPRPPGARMMRARRFA